MDNQRLTEIQERLGYSFKNTEYLNHALTHSSYANEHNNHADCNERLEFLGDSVLGFITAEYFFNHSKQPEGKLTKLRAAAVCEQALSCFAAEIGLGEFLLLGRGEMSTGGQYRPSILADAFEAVIAAIYIDGGIESAKEFVLRFIDRREDGEKPFRDYKTKLQEVVQKNPEERLEYFLADESGPDHDKRFIMEVHLNSNVIGVGEGKSKKIAEQEAAKQALELMGL